jgi:protoporphyrinogen oxidase
MKFDLLIVGAGIAGLAAADQAVSKGKKVMVIESQNVVGGLCASLTINSCIVDYGVHLLHLRDTQVKEYVMNLVDQNEILKIERGGKLYLFGKYINWPLNLMSVFQMPFKLVIKIAMDQIISFKKRVNIYNEDNYATTTQAIYGRSLYENFFGPLTKKFLKIEPTEIHSDWALSSIRSATKIEDEQFNESGSYHVSGANQAAGFSIFRTFIENLRARRQGEDFYYFKNGYGTLADSISSRIISKGGKIILNSKIVKINRSQDNIIDLEVETSETNYTIEANRVLWTGSLETLNQLLGYKESNLERLNSKFVYVYLNTDKNNWQTCYFVDNSIDFVRGTFLSNHSRSIIKRDDVKSVLCLEYTGRKNTLIKVSDQEIYSDLKKSNLILDEKDVVEIHQVDKRSTYPIFTTDYIDNLNEIHLNIDKYKNLFLFGRQGAFSYENADILIKNSLTHIVNDD